MSTLLPEMDHDQERELEALEDILSDPSGDPIKLSYRLLKSVTDDFSNEIGRGGFGVVYKGNLRNGVVAVKRSNGLSVTDKQFMDEIKCLKSTNHKNIVKFLGYCADTQEEVMPLDGTFVMAGERNRLFCFECVPNGNIRQYLEKGKSHGDDWPARYQMIRGICHGLKYLHDKKINHRDLKPENVLLDADMEAKITDFGLSRFLDQGKSQIITKKICGTWRYIAPEVKDRRELSLGSDIYALGVIIIELLTGTSMISLDNWEESLDFPDCPRARLCAEIAQHCMDAKRNNRPTIHEVIHRMDELESTIPVSSTHQLVTAPAFPGTVLLDVYPRELRFLFVADKDEMSCSLTMINKTDSFVYCLVASRDGDKLYQYIMPPMSSSVGELDMNSEEEIPSNMVEWEILMFTTQFKNAQVVKEQGVSYLLGVEAYSLWDRIRICQDVLGGELHRAALTASVIVGSEVIQVHTIDVERPYLTIDWMDVHPTEPWALFIADGTFYIWNSESNEKVGEYKSVQEFLGGELHRPALKASVIVGSEVVQVHTIDKEEASCEIDWMDVHPTEPWVLLGAGGDVVYIWNWQTNEKLGEYNSPVCGVHMYERMSYVDDSVAKFIAREQWAVIGDSDGSITVHTCPRMDQVKKFKAHGDGVSSLAVHPTRPFLLSYSYPISLKLWDWSKDWFLTTTFAVSSPRSQVKFNPNDTTTFATRDQYGVVEMWKIGRRMPIATAQTRDLLHKCSTYFTYTGHRDFTAVIDNDHTISIWDLRKEKHVYTLHNEKYKYVLAVCHPTRRILVLVSFEGRIEVWDPTTYRLKKAYDNVPEDPKHIGFIGSGRLVIGYLKGISMLDIDLE